jgi:hypothetical protein
MRLIEPELVMNQAHDPALLVASPECSGETTPHIHPQPHHTETTRAPPPEYLPSAAYRTGFDFDPLEVFGRAEKERLKIISPVDTKPQSPDQDLRRRLVQVAQEGQQAEEGPTPTAGLPPQLEELLSEASTSTRSRQRKLELQPPATAPGQACAFRKLACGLVHSALAVTTHPLV